MSFCLYIISQFIFVYINCRIVNQIYTFIRWGFNDGIAIVELGLEIERLIDQLLNLHNFSLELERLNSYSHSWRAGVREDTVREVCDGSHRIQTKALGIAGDSYGSHRTHQPINTVL